MTTDLGPVRATRKKKKLILWRFFTRLIWLTVFMTCSIPYVCHRIHRFPIWNHDIKITSHFCQLFRFRLWPEISILFSSYNIICTIWITGAFEYQTGPNDLSLRRYSDSFCRCWFNFNIGLFKAEKISVWQFVLLWATHTTALTSLNPRTLPGLNFS